MCLSGAEITIQGPAALLRGGFVLGSETAGPFEVYGAVRPLEAFWYVGFPGAR